MENKAIKKILIIDNDKEFIKSLAKFFTLKGWIASVAENGRDALAVLKSMLWDCDCIILDLVMEIMDGIEFIQELMKIEPEVKIPIIILSGELQNINLEELYKGHVISVLDKPQKFEILEALATNICNKEHSKLGNNFKENIVNMHAIDEKTHQREANLSSYFNTTVKNLTSNLYNKINEHLFVVARRWNSWYPSFFDVPGGCYAIVSPLCKDRKRNRVITIDPGFRFLKVLSELNISVKDIETCIISHNHPDHLGGSFEFISSRHVTKEKNKLICSPNTYSMFTGYNQDGLEISVLNGMENLIDCKKHPDKKCEVIIDCFDTDHQEIGPRNDSKAIILEYPAYDPIRKIVILGDTSFDLSRNKELFLKHLTHARTKVVVLHIGSAQLKKRINGHLYLQGLHRLLTSMGEKLESDDRPKGDKLIVLISEWGLEHATKQQMKKISPTLTGFDNSSPIIDTINFVKKTLDDLEYNQKMVVIPADIGLMVGIGSGNIYWKQNGSLKSSEPENVKWRCNDDGLEYFV